MKRRFLVLSVCLLFLFNTGNAQKKDTLLSLQDAVELGLRANLRILASEKELTVAKGRAISGLGIDDPFVSGAWSEIPNGNSVSAYGERDFSISQSLDFPTNYVHRKKLGSLDIGREGLIYENTRLTVRTEIEKSYYQVLAKREKLVLTRQVIDLAKEFLNKAESRFDAGKAPYLEVSRAQLALANIENELSMATSDFQTAVANLGALLALPADLSVNASDSLVYQPIHLYLDELTEHAMGSHPELLIVQMDQKMAERNLSLAKGTYLPSIEGSYFLQKIAGEKFHGVALGITLPLWFPVNQKGDVVQGRGNLEAARYRAQDEKIILSARIKNAYSQVMAAKQQVEKYLGDLLIRAQDVYEMTLRSYEEGKVDYLKVLDAQQSLIMINKNYIDAIARYKISVADLEKASNQTILQ
ncbi:MAG TPA: TolC family protein [Bacteroidales bacterium]|nr:TolC family protein [Bacteroidales bacterium]